MKMRHLTFEHALYALAIALALSMRLLNLGAAPLSDYEAAWALRALGVAEGQSVSLGTQPGYGLITGLIFFVLGSTDTLARLLPALVGASLAAAPFFFRHRLGRNASLVLAFALALDPGLVAMSQLAGGPMPAVGFVLWALVAWSQGRPVIAGVLTGLGLLSGPAVLAGGLGLALAWAVAGVLTGAGEGGELASAETGRDSAGVPEGAIRPWLISTGVTLLLAGTLFLRFPGGLGALGNILPAYLEGWSSPSGVPSLQLLMALLVYQPLAVIFGILGGVRAWREGVPFGQRIALWSLAGLALGLLYPARQISDLAWVLVPLWTLAAAELARYFRFDVEDAWVSWGQAALLVVLAAFIWINLAGLVGVSPGTSNYTLRWLVIAGALGLGALTTALVSMGWTSRIAWSGLVLGLTVAFGGYGLASSWGLNPSASDRVQDWWYPQPATVAADIFLRTIGDLSEWQTGRRDAVEVVLAPDSPSLKWYLRRFPNARQERDLANDTLPVVVVTRQGDGINLPDIYRGTDVLWWVSPTWEGALPAEGLRWLIFREGVTQPEHITVWARNDLFPDSVISVSPSSSSGAEDESLENIPGN